MHTRLDAIEQRTHPGLSSLVALTTVVRSLLTSPPLRPSAPLNSPLHIKYKSKRVKHPMAEDFFCQRVYKNPLIESTLTAGGFEKMEAYELKVQAEKKSKRDGVSGIESEARENESILDVAGRLRQEREVTMRGW